MECITLPPHYKLPFSVSSNFQCCEMSFALYPITMGVQCVGGTSEWMWGVNKPTSFGGGEGFCDATTVLPSVLLIRKKMA